MGYTNILWNMEMPVTAGLSSGKVGVLLLHFERYKTCKDPQLLHWIEKQVANIVSTIGNEDSLLSYYPANYSYGMAGICQTIRGMLKELKFNIDYLDEYLNEMDEILLECCTDLMDKGKFNLFYGLAGPFNYFLTHNLHIQAIATMIEQLAFTYPMDGITKTFRSNGELNYSTAFGVTGWLAVMLKTLRYEEIGKSKKQLIAQIVPHLSKLTFGKFSGTVGDSSVDDLGWSQGLLMPCLVLYRYGQQAEERTVMDRSLACALRAARSFSLSEEMAEQFELGSGLGGIKEIFNAFYKETQIIDFLIVSNAIEQFLQQEVLNRMVSINKYNCSLLNGAAGLYLTADPLFAGIQQSWQELLLIQG